MKSQTMVIIKTESDSDEHKTEIDRKIREIKQSYIKYKLLKRNKILQSKYTNKNVEQKNIESYKKNINDINDLKYIQPVMSRNFRRNEIDDRADRMEALSNIESEFYSSLRKHHFSIDEIKYMVTHMKKDLIYNQTLINKTDSCVSIYTQIDGNSTILSYDGIFYTSKPISLKNRINFSSREKNQQYVNNSCVYIDLI
jgi:hypothetical protein